MMGCPDVLAGLQPRDAVASRLDQRCLECGEATRRTAEHRSMVLCAATTGRVSSEHEHKNVFKRFYRLDGSRCALYDYLTWVARENVNNLPSAI
jgi:hypothetical protein